MGILEKFTGKSRTYEHTTVMVVDDNEIDRKIIEETLNKLGCKVVSAENGRQGYSLALASKPDLILSDCMMPELDGVEMTKQIRENVTIKDIPVIFLTGADSPKKVVECFDVEAHNYMCKPINAKLLTSQIIEILDQHFPES